MKRPDRLFLAALSSIVFVGAAQAGDPDLDRFLAEMAAQETVLDVSQHDIGKDGTAEALVRMAAPCEEAACEWRFVAKIETGWAVVGQGFAEDAFLEKTAGDDAVLNTDGVTWAWSGTKLYPYASLLETAVSVDALPEEIAFIAGSSRFTEQDKMRASIFRTDLFGDGSEDRIFLIKGLYYTVGTWGTPYLIYDDQDRLIDSGVSMDMPRIYLDAKGNGFHVVEVTPFSTSVKTVR